MYSRIKGWARPHFLKVLIFFCHVLTPNKSCHSFKEICWFLKVWQTLHLCVTFHHRVPPIRLIVLSKFHLGMRSNRSGLHAMIWAGQCNTWTLDACPASKVLLLSLGACAGISSEDLSDVFPRMHRTSRRGNTYLWQLANARDPSTRNRIPLLWVSPWMS